MVGDAGEPDGPSAPLVFLDTETTGLHRERQPWEIAIIRRTDAGQRQLHLCVDIQDLDLESADPAGLEISGFHKRHPQVRLRPLQFPRIFRAAEAVSLVDQWTAGATIVGVIPQFDAECLTRMFLAHGTGPAWNPALVDVVALTAARIRERGLTPDADYSNLSLQFGVKTPSAGQRHTALGDARWAMRWYDRLSE
ncbi:exonuclease domain-containing protein [Mycobacteroides salmoniphilum]|uniref:Exonuclease domain-containing protein n=1 Tax=Mycobacteroides salmoniphilum TaxID=404941 RepID=A0A4R8SNY5_9MYCO|nr:exonuclease domain-containing protein [Mycobacteroides salmoniphilum]TDZ90846.1 hypothetical protein CCUG62472_04100 [Mycobacteroides salmoniphilum]TEA00764.1 hypothetical protein CCUG60884_04657 [Mycobacteroides salmoniphilum]